MRIAHVITRMIVGGAQENTLYNCLDLIADHGDEVLLLTGPSLGPEGDLIEQFRRRGRAGELGVCRIDSLRRSIHPRDAIAARSLRRALKQFRPDVVHTHSAKGGLLGRSVAWGLNVPAVIHTVHGAPFHDYQSTVARRFFIACERWAARRCHRLISVADAMMDLMVQAGVAPREKFTTIYSGMEVEPFLEAGQGRAVVRKELGFEEDDVVIGKIARLFHLKGHDDLIESAAMVVRANPRVKFLLVGDGILRESLERRIAELRLTNHFRLVGLVPPAEVPGLIGAMDVLVHTSLREGLARALPQALITGIPAVSYDIDGAREVVIDDETGSLIPPRDIEALSAALIELAGDGDRRRRLGGQGRVRFTDQFRHTEMTRRIREVYQSVLAEN